MFAICFLEIVFKYLTCYFIQSQNILPGVRDDKVCFRGKVNYGEHRWKVSQRAESLMLALSSKTSVVEISSGRQTWNERKQNINN